MFIALSHYRSGAVRRGRTNYVIDSEAHSAPPNGASGGKRRGYKHVTPPG